MNDDLYKLIPEEGKHLAKSKDTDDAYRGVYLDDETNKPCGAGEFVKVNPDELLDREETEPIVEDSTVAALLVAIGVAIGIGAAKAYPRVKTWVVNSVIPKVKPFWGRKLQSGEETENAQLPAADETSDMSDQTILSLNVVLNDYKENMTSEDAQRELIEAFILYLTSAQKLSRLANANIVDAKGKILDSKFLLEMMTDKQLLDSINSVIQSNPALLSDKQISTLADVLGYNVITEKEYVPIMAHALQEGLRRTLEE